MLPGGQTVLCYQTAYQLPLKGDLFTFTHLFSWVTFQLSYVEILKSRSIEWLLWTSMEIFYISLTVFRSQNQQLIYPTNKYNSVYSNPDIAYSLVP